MFHEMGKRGRFWIRVTGIRSNPYMVLFKWTLWNKHHSNHYSQHQQMTRLYKKQNKTERQSWKLKENTSSTGKRRFLRCCIWLTEKSARVFKSGPITEHGEEKMLSRIGVNTQSKSSVIQSFARPVSKGILRFTSLKDPTIPMRDCLQHRMFDKMHPAKY